MDINGTKEVVNQGFNQFYLSVSGLLPEEYRILISLFFYIIIIFLYAIFIWKFYRFLAKRDIVKLDFSRYNKSAHPTIKKFFAGLFFLLIYMIISPIIVFFWFAVLAVFILVLSKSQDISQVILISAAIVGATRLSAYYSDDLSKDLAKMFPFTLLGVFLLDPNFFSMNEFLSRVMSIPNFLSQIMIYLIFIIAIEVILRIVFGLVDLFRSNRDIKNSAISAPSPI